MLDPKLVRSRLAFVRHLYRHGVEQADQPEPLRAFSILTFHDAAELFLGLALDHSGVVVPGGQAGCRVLGLLGAAGEGRPSGPAPR